jgi:hypothetical protein
MSLFANRHLRTSLLVAPILAVVSYAAADYYVSERPAAAIRGGSYPLREASSCRYASGFCQLENGDVELGVRARRLDSTQVELTLVSEQPLDQALVAVGTGDEFGAPVSFRDDRVHLTLPRPTSSRLRWAVSIRGSTFYAETAATFVDEETLLPQGEGSARARSERGLVPTAE